MRAWTICLVFSDPVTYEHLDNVPGFLRSGQFTLYSDLLLGDHLTAKSTTVYWVDEYMPQKRSSKVLEQIARH